jgi:hypothetical protein
MAAVTTTDQSMKPVGELGGWSPDHGPDQDD